MGRRSPKARERGSEPDRATLEGEETLQSGLSTYTVYCSVKHNGLGGARALAADLLEGARRALAPTPRTRGARAKEPRLEPD